MWIHQKVQGGKKTVQVKTYIISLILRSMKLYHCPLDLKQSIIVDTVLLLNYVYRPKRGLKQKSMLTDEVGKQILRSLQECICSSGNANDDEEELYGKSIAANF